MKRQKLIVLFLITLLVFTLAGCGQATENPTTDSTGDSPAALMPEDSFATSDDAADYAGESEASSAESPQYKSPDNNGLYADSAIVSPDLYEPFQDNIEEYSPINENGFVNVKGSPLSTFSADVDTASYTNLRRMIEDGYRLSDIPTDSIRI